SCDGKAAPLRRLLFAGERARDRGLRRRARDHGRARDRDAGTRVGGARGLSRARGHGHAAARGARRLGRLPQRVLARGADIRLPRGRARRDDRAFPFALRARRRRASPSEPPGRARVISVEEVYRFEPMPAGLAADEQRHILGVQANIWTEHIRTEERVGWMALPRAAALAEVGWTGAEQRDWI